MLRATPVLALHFVMTGFFWRSGRGLWDCVQAMMFLDLGIVGTDIGICVFSAPSQASGVIGWFVFSLIQAPHLHQDWKHHLGDLPFTWKSSLLTRLADQFLIQAFGGREGGSFDASGRNS